MASERIRAVYKQFRHLNQTFEAAADDDPLHRAAAALWAAVRAEVMEASE